jgi:hypothetical protein
MNPCFKTLVELFKIETGLIEMALDILVEVIHHQGTVSNLYPYREFFVVILSKADGTG